MSVVLVKHYGNKIGGLVARNSLTKYSVICSLFLLYFLCGSSSQQPPSISKDIENVSKLYQYYIDDQYAYEKVMWPWLNLVASPVYTRLVDGITHEGIPVFGEDAKFSHTKTISGDIGFWKRWENSYNGKGISISISDNLVEETVRFLQSYSQLGGTLPVELVHTGLSSLHKLLLAEHVEKLGLEVWLVDVSPMIKTGYEFKEFENKWLAVLFSSFEEILLLDSDVVIFQDPLYFFETKEYAKTNTLFFRDRLMTDEEVPSFAWDYVDRLVDELEDYTSSESALVVYNYVKYKIRHQMESGLVAYKKSRYMLQLLTSMFLHMNSQYRHFVHGDKEWFWLSHVFLQTHFGVPANFSFHNVPASATGTIREVTELGDGFYEICSSQISHTDGAGKLLWINGGLRVCKKPSHKWDYDHVKVFKERFQNVDAVRTYYNQPISLEFDIVPEVTLHEPVRPFEDPVVDRRTDWAQVGECAKFCYCSVYKQNEFGILTHFQDAERYNDIRDAWMKPVY